MGNYPCGIRRGAERIPLSEDPVGMQEEAPLVIIIMGVSGAGKSTVGRLLARALQWPYYEADEFHSSANIEKMKDGIPLTDADRGPWLASLARMIAGLGRSRRAAVVACSALRQKYRDTLAGGSADVRFVYLKGDEDLIRKRLLSRQEHFMKADLLKSQFETLEEPEAAVVVDAAVAPEEIVRRIRQALGV